MCVCDCYVYIYRYMYLTCCSEQECWRRTNFLLGVHCYRIYTVGAVLPIVVHVEESYWMGLLSSSIFTCVINWKKEDEENSNGIFFMLFTYLLKSACCIFKKAFRVLNIFSLFNSIFMNFTVHCTVFLCYVLLQIAEALMEALQAIDWLDEYIEGLSD